LCILTIAFSLSISSVNAILQNLMVLWLSCTELQIPHFFCELALLACSDNLIDNINSCKMGGASLSGIVFSYIHIIFSVWRMPSLSGKYKAFFTCRSHLSVVSLFYGTVVGM
jgi:olfactory receptor